jgi:hypothetical protein
MIEHLLSKHEMRPEFRPKYHQKKKKKKTERESGGSNQSGTMGLVRGPTLGK